MGSGYISVLSPFATVKGTHAKCNLTPFLGAKQVRRNALSGGRMGRAGPKKTPGRGRAKHSLGEE